MLICLDSRQGTGAVGRSRFSHHTEASASVPVAAPGESGVDLLVVRCHREDRLSTRLDGDMSAKASAPTASRRADICKIGHGRTVVGTYWPYQTFRCGSTRPEQKSSGCLVSPLHGERDETDIPCVRRNVRHRTLNNSLRKSLPLPVECLGVCPASDMDYRCPCDVRPRTYLHHVATSSFRDQSSGSAA